jgi:hypothetical protein
MNYGRFEHSFGWSEPWAHVFSRRHVVLNGLIALGSADVNILHTGNDFLLFNCTI